MTTQQLIRKADLQVPEKDLEELIRRIVEVADPQKIILFGSAVKGTMGPHSDLDVLVVKPGEYNQIRATQSIYRSLRGFPYAVDVIVNTPERVERYKDCWALIQYPATHDGIVIYDASDAR